VIIEEINMIYDNPMLHAGLLWRKLLYGDQPAGRDIAGTKETVSKMTSKLLKDYMEKQYTAQNTIVCLAGNFNHKSAVKKTKEIFSSIKQGSPFKKSKVSESQSSPGIMVHYRDTDQTHLCLGVRAFNIFHPFRYTQDVMAAILGGMMSSRLFIEVREKLGLAYYIKTEADADPDTGFLATLAGVDNKRAEKAISTILKAYKNISRQKVGSLELKKAKDNIKGKLSLMLEPSDAKASFYGIQELSEKRILTPEKLFKEIDKVGSDDILKLGRDIFRPEKLNLALIGPFKNKDKFKKLLV